MVTNTKDTLFNRLKEEKPPEWASEKKEARYSSRIRIIIIISTILIISFFFTINSRQFYHQIPEYNLIPGTVWYHPDEKAEFTFPIFKDKNQLNDEIKAAKSKVPPVYVINEDSENDAKSKLSLIIKYLAAGKNNQKEIETFIPDKFFDITESIPKKDLNDELKRIENAISRSVSEIYSRGFISNARRSIKSEIIIIRLLPNSETIKSTSQLIDSVDFIKIIKTSFEKKFPDRLASLTNDIALKVISPNYKYSWELTNKNMELADKSVARTVGIVRKGDIIIKKGERATDRQILKIKSYNISKFEKSDTEFHILTYLGTILHSFLIYGILLIYLFILRKRIFYDNIQFFILNCIIVFICLQTWITFQIPSRFPLEFTLMLPALSMLVAIVFDSRTAFNSTVVMALFIAGIRGNDYVTLMTMMLAGTMAAYSVRDIQNRTQMYQSIFFIFIGFILAITAFSLERSADIVSIVYRILIALINSAISPLVTFGLLFLIERSSNISSDLRIKEFDNLNHPLLIKLSELAPGTYQHTLSVAALAERCARNIKANALLTKVGTYFHDIGKISRPEYFAENQLDMTSKHDQISPRKSANAIKEHVTGGIELARQYRLPERLIDFIPMHHGTSLIRHFYAKALEESKGENVNENDFRYPGPKPDIKETAILMICDTAEAISRLFTDKEDLHKALNKLVEEKMLDGQFDNCNITIKEINTVIDTCVRNLSGVTHQRVAYKEPKKEEVQDEPEINIGE
jgi:cyclic-di-AMP phosphodiesterase PgpH